MPGAVVHGPSGDDVGEQLVLDLGDAVLERQLLFLQPLDLQIVARACVLK